MARCLDFENHYTASLDLPNVQRHLGRRVESAVQPGDEVFVALGFGRVGIEGRSHDVVGLICNTPDEVSAWALMQRSRVGKTRNPRTDRFRIAQVLLELDPLGLGGAVDELVNHARELVRAQSPTMHALLRFVCRPSCILTR